MASAEGQRHKQLQQWPSHLSAAQMASKIANTIPGVLNINWLCKHHLPWPLPSPQAH